MQFRNGNGDSPSIGIFGQRTLVVAAHPDDETIGMGGQFKRMGDCIILHVTDGAPKSMSDALRNGFASREEYAATRRAELLEALSLAELDLRKAHSLGYTDQEASLHLPDLTAFLAEAIFEFHPSVIVTHPLEGGHPDHDATAFAVHAACRLLHQGGRPSPRIVEFTSYHEHNGAMRAGQFLPAGSPPVLNVWLSHEDRRRKKRMLSCFRTQSQTLGPFPMDVERFRPAPWYKLTEPPCDSCYYDRFDWGIKSADWRQLAREAVSYLKVPAQ